MPVAAALITSSAVYTVHRRRPKPSPFAAALLLFLALLAGTSHCKADRPCQTEDDLDFTEGGCTLQHLPDAALEAICDRIGLDLEEHVFPYLFEGDDIEDEDEFERLDGEGFEAAAREDEERPKQSKRDPTHDDYVLAAMECLDIEAEMERMMQEDPEGMAELERAMLAEDPELLSDIVADVLSQSPDLVKELEIELQREEPELFDEMMAELAEGQKLTDRPEVLAQLVSVMLTENPDLLEKLDADIATHMSLSDDDDDGEDGELGDGVVDGASDEL